eukprot:jgi/Picre1/33918/NNA_001397.t1
MFSRVFRTPQNRPDFEQQNRGRRRPRDEGWEDSQRPISLPPTFADAGCSSASSTSARTVGPLRKVSRAPSNWYLKQGQTWTGWQHVQHWPPGSSEKWNVRVVLDHVDLERGEVFGTMTATDVPGAESQVVTYFEGEMIDNENATFYSDPDASARVCLSELRHWSRFPAFRPLRDGVLEEDGRSPELAASSKVFMRWKEKCFLSGGDCRLTIAGVYYVTLDRRNGDVNAYYFDQNSAPEQRMILKAGAGNASNQQQGYALPGSNMRDGCYGKVRVLSLQL